MVAPSDLDDLLCVAVHAAAGELQSDVAEVGPTGVFEADLRRALRRGLQFQLGGHVRPEYPVPKGSEWGGRLGGFDLAVMDPSGGLRAAIEVKWCRDADKLYEAIWDAFKLVPLSSDERDHAAYLVYGAPASTWATSKKRPAELFADGQHDIADLLSRYESAWRWLLTGNKSARPRDLRSRFTTTLVASLPVHVATGEDWELRCVRVQATSDPVLFFNDDGWLSDDQPAFGPPAPASRFIDTDADVQFDPATDPRNADLIDHLKDIGASYEQNEEEHTPG